MFVDFRQWFRVLFRDFFVFRFHCAGEVYPGKYTWTDGRRTNGRRTDDGRKNFGQKNSDEKIPTKKFRRKKSDEKIPTKKFRRKNSDEKIWTKKNWGQGTGARHGRCGGKARVINGDSWGAKPPRPPGGARHGTPFQKICPSGANFLKWLKKRRLREIFFEKIFFEKYFSKNIFRKIFFEKYGRSDPAVGLSTAWKINFHPGRTWTYGNVRGRKST